MNAADVLAITRDGEIACEECLQDQDERDVFNDAPNARSLMEEHDMAVIFASDCPEDETCGRCGNRLMDQ